MKFLGVINYDNKTVKLISSAASVGYMTKICNMTGNEVADKFDKTMELCRLKGIHIDYLENIQKHPEIIVQIGYVYKKGTTKIAAKDIDEAVKALKELYPDKNESNIKATIKRNLSGSTKTCYGGSWQKIEAKYNLKDFKLEYEGE